jgi:hypothetical protein
MKRLSASAPALFAVAAAVIAAACSGTSEPAPAPATIVLGPAAPVLTAVGATQQLTAAVKDQHGDSMPGATVAWVSATPTVATVGASTGLVTAVANGTSLITASAGSASQSVTVTVAQAAAALVLISGDAQAGTVGQALGSPLVARVDDANAHPIAGLAVTFATGTGAVGSPSAVTGANGQAQSTWTLGTTAGAQTATATRAGTSPVTYHATAGAGNASTAAVQAGDGQSAVTGADVATPPAVVVRDAFSNVKPGAIVTFAVTAGGGSVTKPVDTTDAAGVASVGGWTLGAVGTNTLTATVSGTAVTASFTATALAATGAAHVVAFAGASQTGLVGYAVNVRPAVLVTDASDQPVAGAGVTFAVGSGGGSATGASVLTDANGVAQVGSWTLGATPGANTLTATVSGAGISGNPVTAGATGAAPTFNIDLQVVGPMLSASAQAAFDAAVAKWQRIIYQDIPDIPNFSAAAGACGTWSPAVGPVTVDDILILVNVDSIDGPGKVLGQAGPCYIRTASRLTIMGMMQFDSADVDTLAAHGRLAATITHEMGHVLGFGTLWTQAAFNCLQNASSVGTPLDTYFSCAYGQAMFDSIGGTSYTGGLKVPVENCGPASPAGCGAGTINSHWREPVLTAELMTGYLDNGVPTPLSRLSAAAMQDLGYVVNYAGSDPFLPTFSLLAPGARAGGVFLGEDVYRGPIYVVDRTGRVVNVIRAPLRR